MSLITTDMDFTMLEEVKKNAEAEESMLEKECLVGSNEKGKACDDDQVCSACTLADGQAKATVDSWKVINDKVIKEGQATGYMTCLKKDIKES